jgi:hypothetical protein
MKALCLGMDRSARALAGSQIIEMRNQGMNTRQLSTYLQAAAFLTLLAKSPDSTECFLACSAQSGKPGIRFWELIIAISWALISLLVIFFA